MDGWRLGWFRLVWGVWVGLVSVGVVGLGWFGLGCGVVALVVPGKFSFDITFILSIPMNVIVAGLKSSLMIGT